MRFDIFCQSDCHNFSLELDCIRNEKVRIEKGQHVIQSNANELVVWACLRYPCISSPIQYAIQNVFLILMATTFLGAIGGNWILPR